MPEHCRFIGLTDEIMDDYKAFREVRFTRRTDAPVKIKESTQFVTMLHSSAQVVQRMKAWSFFVEPKVCEFPGVKYHAGNVIMGQKPRPFDPSQMRRPTEEESKQPERFKFSIEESGKDLNLSLTKNKLFDQPIIQKWGIFYQSRDHQQAKTLVHMLEKVLLQFDYQAKPMAMFPVQGNNLEIWRQELIQKVRADVQVVILLLPGRQGRSDLYPDLKKLLTQEIPIVSQAILTSTINYGRNLRSIVCKLVA